MRIALILAASENNVIGCDGQLPWRLKGDMRHFKATTMGKPVIMGRRTWESLSVPLSGRYNIVLSRILACARGAEVVRHPDAAIESARIWGTAHGAEEIMVIGGAEIYTLFEPLAHHIYLTRVHSYIEGDSVYRLRTPHEWHHVESTHHRAENGECADYSFIELTK